jgi:redox-sensitive bicupin YhaK (pirin superfamily)
MTQVIKENQKTLRVLNAMKIDMGGFPVKQALPLEDVSNHDPFLLLHHGSQVFDKNQKAIHQGVGPHPHRGFSPVTFMLRGEIHHRDSRGNDQIAGEGEVQWMSAGAGIIHSERPSQHIVDEGIEQEFIQLWINTPADQKMQPPEYTYLSREDIPTFHSVDQKINNRLVTGEYEGVTQGKIRAGSEVLILWIEAQKGGQNMYTLPRSHNSMLYLPHGEIMLNGQNLLSGQLAVLEKGQANLEIEVKKDSQFFIFSGEPLQERVFQHGPFVMNSKSQILEAMRDYQMGKMGFLVEK